MGGLILKLQNFKKVKLIFGHPVLTVIDYRGWSLFVTLFTVTLGE